MGPEILLVEDDPRFAALVGALLTGRPCRFRHAADGETALALVREARPRVILLDLSLPDCEGLDLLRSLADVAKDVPILVLTVSCASETIVAALRLGAAGYLLKQDVGRRLYLAIDEVLAGGTPLSSAAGKAVVDLLREPDRARASNHADDVPRLSPRERDVLRELGRGLTYEHVALVLGVSVNTVRAHVKSLYDKLGVSSRAEAIMEGLRSGLLEAP